METGIPRISQGPQSPGTRAGAPSAPESPHGGFGQDSYLPSPRDRSAPLIPPPSLACAGVAAACPENASSSFLSPSLACAGVAAACPENASSSFLAPSLACAGVAAAALVADGQTALAPLSSMEFKMLLAPGHFTDDEKGFADFWALVHRTAESQGLEVKDSSSATATRHIAYLDTPEFALNRQGYILRMRQDGPITLAKGRGGDVEVALKFRSTDRELAASKDVTPSEGYGVKAKFEKDVVSQKDSLRDIFSKSAKIDVDGVPGSALGDYGALYPTLGDLGIAPETRIDVVNGKRVEERYVKPGAILLADGVKAKAAVSVWRLQSANAQGAPFVAEFSFSFSVAEDASPEQIARAEAASRTFLTALRSNAAAWAHEGGTKTELIYGEGSGGEEG